MSALYLHIFSNKKFQSFNEFYYYNSLQSWGLFTHILKILWSESCIYLVIIRVREVDVNQNVSQMQQ